MSANEMLSANALSYGAYSKENNGPRERNLQTSECARRIKRKKCS